MGFAIFLVVVIVVLVLLFNASKKARIEDSNFLYKMEQERLSVLAELGMNYTSYIFVFPDFIYYDENVKKLAIFGGSSENIVYNYGDILDFELVENGETYKKSGNGVFRAVVGGAVFGTVGAIVGATTTKTKEYNEVNSLDINIFLKGGTVKKIKFIRGPLRIDSPLYSAAKEESTQLLAILTDLTSSDQPQLEDKEIVIQPTSADEIAKFKKLLDDGAISFEEYEEKKQQLLKS